MYGFLNAETFDWYWYIYYQYQWKVWTHLFIQWFFFILMFSTFHINILDIQTMKEHMEWWRWKMLIKPECFIFYILQSSHLLLWWQLCTLLVFFQSASWGSHLEWFSNCLEGVSRSAEHLFAALPSLCGPTHPRPSQLGLGQVIVEARSSDAALDHSFLVK